MKQKQKKKQKTADDRTAAAGENERTAEGRADSDVEADLIEGRLPTGKNYVFQPPEVARIDELAKRINRTITTAARYGNLPRTHFQRGISNLAKLNAHERPGVLLVLLMILVMEYWAEWGLADRYVKGDKRGETKDIPPGNPGYLYSVLGTERADCMIRALGVLLAYEAFLRSEEIPETLLLRVQRYIPKMLRTIIETFPRDGTGVGHKRIKVHLVTHVVDDIMRFGSPQNTNSSVGEKAHIQHIKIPGHNASKIHRDFEPRVGVHYSDNQLVDRASVDQVGIKTYNRDGEAVKQRAEALDCPFNPDCLLLVVHQKHYQIKGAKKPAEELPVWNPNSAITPRHMIDIIQKQILPKMPDDCRGIPIYGRIRLKGVPVYGHPCWGDGSKESMLAKQDWVRVNFDDQLVPFQCLGFFKLEMDPTEKIAFEDSNITGKGWYAFGHSAIEHLRDHGEACYKEGTKEEGNLDLYE